MAIPVQGLTRAFNGGAESFFRGMRYAEDEGDRDRKRQQEGAQDARKKVIEGREDSNYAYEEGLRPLKREAAELGVSSARQQVEKGAIDNENARAEQVVSSLKDAWKMARYGDLEGALGSINKTRGGKEPVKALEWHPDDPGMDLVIATDNKDQKHIIDLRQLDGRFKPASEKGRFTSDKYGVLDTMSGKFTKHDAGVGGDDGETPKLVELTNGQRLPREELRKTFETTYGKFDPATKLFVWQDGTPNYFDWYNSVVAEKHRFPVTEAKQTGMDEVDARKSATKIADERDPIGPNFLRPGATKEAYGGMTREEFILKKAQELQSGVMSGGMTQAPGQATQSATASEVLRIPDSAQRNVLPPGINTKADLDKLEQRRTNKDYGYVWGN